MEDVRQLVQEEGREARNLLAFHVAVDSPAPPAPRPPLRALPPRRAPPPARRSASAGRDKRSELRARYWALLFGDLQRAIGEIYNTVEAHENLNECQEVILVLENYTRDFKALGEWFKVKWEYDNTPPPQRPQSLAWEIRKTDFVRPESRKAYSVRSSPSVSGKNSPSLSGHNTPSGKHSPVPGKASPGSGKVSPRISVSSPKGNVEFFSNKLVSKNATKPEVKLGKDGRLFDIKEKETSVDDTVTSKISVPQEVKDEKIETKVEKYEPKQDISGTKLDRVEPKQERLVSKQEKTAIKNDKTDKHAPIVEIGKAKECANVTPSKVVIKSAKNAKSFKKPTEEISSQAKETIRKLDAMENEFLFKNLSDNFARNDNLINQEREPTLDKDNKENEEAVADKTSENIVDSDKIEGANGKTVVNNVSAIEHEKNMDIESSKSDNIPANIFDEIVQNAFEKKVSDIENINAPVESADNEITTRKQPKNQNNSNKSDSENIQQPNSETMSATDDKISKIDQDPKSAEISNDSIAKETTANKSKKNEVAPEKGDSKFEDQKKEPKDTKLSSETKPTDIKPARPAYSTAAAKPKLVSAKTETKTVKTTPIVRSKTVVEMQNAALKTRPYPKRVQNQINKCSYPFNLTTGRKSLFDGTNNVSNTGKIIKKPIPKSQIGSGDNLNKDPKSEVKKRPRPTTLKINEKGDKEVNNMSKSNDCDEFSSTDTLVTQMDMSRIESSESLKTLVPEDFLDSNSVEVLNIDRNKNDNEGWLTVKSRKLSREYKKQSKSHWSNRFNQPSATTSLPTLNMIESPKQESNPVIKRSRDDKCDRAKSEQPESVKTIKAVKLVKTTNRFEKNRDPAIIRQKSDVTGLQTRSARHRANKKDKMRDLKGSETQRELTKNRLHSSLESLTTGLARSQESTEDSFDFDKWKLEFKSTFKYLEEEDQDQIPNDVEILKSADPSEMSEIQAMTSQIEENEKKISWALDFQSEVDTRKLCEEEALLNRQILELQQVSDIDMDTETDDTETDAEILPEEPLQPCQPPTALGELAASLEDQYEMALAGMSWAERVDTLGVLEALVARDPGRAQQLHAKLSQGIRRGSLQDAVRRLQTKQARAERQRHEYRTERANRIHQLLSRVEEVKIAKNQLIEEKRLRMERRLQKAAENRDQHLKDIVRKAHDEEEKLREIAFIKQLELENRRHEFLEQCRSHTTRLRVMRRHRLGKLEQKAAREAAVGARRQAIEAARKLHVETLLERRKERDARVEELKELKKQERDDAAREKAEGVKSRLSALAAAAELEADALRSRIRDKQDASQQRLESHLQAIREKATCRQPTISEGHDAEKEMQEEAERLQQDRKDKDKQKTVKKRARKVKQKLLFSSNDTAAINDSVIEPIQPSANKLYKVIHQLRSLLTPLLDTENDSKKCDSNGLDNEVERNNKKNKELANNNDLAENVENKKAKKNKKEVTPDSDIDQNKTDNKKPSDKEITATKETFPEISKIAKVTEEKAANEAPVKENDASDRKNTHANKKKNNKDRKSKEKSPGSEKNELTETKIVIVNRENANNTNNYTDPNSNSNTATEKQKNVVDNLKIDAGPRNKLNDANEKQTAAVLSDKQKNAINYLKTEMIDITATIGDVKPESYKKKNKKSRNNSLSSKEQNVERLKLTRLSKASSVCSSLSDMSKTSGKSDRRCRDVIDTTLLDRSLNELHRLTDKFDQNSKEKILSQKIHALKIVGQLLTVAAEREELTSQISCKSLTTAMYVVCRLISTCQTSASCFLNSNMCVHAVKLLSNQLEKDLQDPKEAELAKQLCVCLSIALDSVLYSMRTREKGDKANEEDSGTLAALRSRAHTLISYICLTGCASVEAAGDARVSVQTLLTVCADLCQPSDLDGSDRAAAMQSFRCALTSTLCGARAELCMLYAPAPLEPDRNVLVRAAATVRMLRAVAELDHLLVQESFSAGGWPLEFRAAVARLLGRHAPNDKDAPAVQEGQNLEHNLEESMVLDLIVLIGFVVVNNTQLQETICDGWSVVKTLCTLPANWLVSRPHCHALLPTLVALAERPSAHAAIAAELSMEMLDEYMTSPEAQKVKLAQAIKQGKAKKDTCKK